MDKLIKPGQIIFSIGIIGLAIICFISKDFIAGRPPASSWNNPFSGNAVWAYVSGSILIVASIAIIVGMRGRIASIIIAIMILLFSFVLRHLYEMTDWINGYKALALAGGAFIVAASFRGKTEGKPNYFLTNYSLVLTGCLFLSLFFIICGLAHFRFAAGIATGLIPDYIPFRYFWTNFCGVCLLAAGVGVLIPPIRKWAALLAGIMILGWFILLHIPRFIQDTNNASDRMGLCESFTFVGILFVLAGIVSKKVADKSF